MEHPEVAEPVQCERRAGPALVVAQVYLFVEAEAVELLAATAASLLVLEDEDDQQELLLVCGLFLATRWKELVSLGRRFA